MGDAPAFRKSPAVVHQVGNDEQQHKGQ